MNSISAHVEYLLRKHDCVVLPGMGALLCNYVPAHFDVSNPLKINPPGRALAFNAMLVESDGMLAWSVARREGISFECASRKVADEVEMLRRELFATGEFAFGRLGMFETGADGTVVFTPSALPSVNGAFYGLQPVDAVPVEQIESARGNAPYAAGVSEAVVAESRMSRRSGWRAYATGVVASLAIVLTAVMFLLPQMNVDRPVETASIAPVPVAEIDMSARVDCYNIAMQTAALPVRLKQIPEIEKDAAEIVAQNEPVVAQQVKPAQVNAVPRAKAVAEVPVKPSEVAKRFNDSDSYCVIVASFPTRSQADEFVAHSGSRRLGILEKDNKFRVFAATAQSYAGANEQKKLVGQADAWVCRR